MESVPRFAMLLKMSILMHVRGSGVAPICRRFESAFFDAFSGGKVKSGLRFAIMFAMRILLFFAGRAWNACPVLL